MSYHRFLDDEGKEYGSFETFYVGHRERIDPNSDAAFLLKGWYWWACFPGCLPDGEPCGPFASEQAAIDDARA